MYTINIHCWVVRSKPKIITLSRKLPDHSANVYLYLIFYILNLCFDRLRNNLRLIIDEIGKSSAIAQHLETPLTSAEKLINSDHVIYMMTEQNTPA